MFFRRPLIVGSAGWPDLVDSSFLRTTASLDVSFKPRGKSDGNNHTANGSEHQSVRLRCLDEQGACASRRFAEMCLPKFIVVLTYCPKPAAVRQIRHSDSVTPNDVVSGVDDTIQIPSSNRFAPFGGRRLRKDNNRSGRLLRNDISKHHVRRARVRLTYSR